MPTARDPVSFPSSPRQLAKINVQFALDHSKRALEQADEAERYAAAELVTTAVQALDEALKLLQPDADGPAG